MSRRTRNRSPRKRTGAVRRRNPRRHSGRRRCWAGGRSFRRRLRYHRRSRWCCRFRRRRRRGQGLASTLLDFFDRACHRADFARMDLRNSDAGIHRMRRRMRRHGVSGWAHRSVSRWARRRRSGWVNRHLRRRMRRGMAGSRSGRSVRMDNLRHRRAGRGRARGPSLGLSWRRSLDLSRSNRRFCNGFLPGLGADARTHLVSLIVIQRTRMRLLVFDAQTG